ncbi:MAG: hypothetical protein PHT91_01640, partial [Candidatus Nanoarchaeia archaeon]|nr:hypothetical protein [Candidatus Nanoarchaeia archaeon]
MKKIIFAFLMCLFVFSIAKAQSDSARDYPFFERIIDSVRLFFSSGESRINELISIREKEINSAIFNAANGQTAKAASNLENAKKAVQEIQTGISSSNAEKIMQSSEAILLKINEELVSSESFDDYFSAETQALSSAELFNATLDYCKNLAQTDYMLMLNEESCNPETADFDFNNDLIQYKNLYEESFNSLMLSIQSCIDDPLTCNCEDITDATHKSRCEKMVSLALKCEYQDNNASCNELEAMRPEESSGFAQSFIPSFLRELFESKSSMIEYDIEKSDIPRECYEDNELAMCEQYGGETSQGIREPTMQESIPECFDAEGIFMEEECGEVIMVRNEEGLVNYLI